MNHEPQPVKSNPVEWTQDFDDVTRWKLENSNESEWIFLFVGVYNSGQT